MKITKNRLVAMIFATCFTQTHASYEVIVNVPEALNIKMINIVPHSPFVGEWVDKGSPTNCSAWVPLPTTVKKGQTFEQSSTCSQEQIRKIEEQVKNLSSGLISKTGKTSEESKNISVSKKQSSIGTKPIVKECVYGATYGHGFWLERPDNTVYFIWYGPQSGSTETLSKTLPGKPTSYIQDGYTYSRGDYNSYSSVSGYYYKICREG